MIIHTLLILGFAAFCMLIGILIGSRNHARIEADLDDAKSDINAIKDKLAALRAPLPRPAVQPATTTTGPATTTRAS